MSRDDRRGQEASFVINTISKPTPLHRLTNNDIRKSSLIADASIRSQALYVPRPEADRSADPNRGDHARSDQASYGSLRHAKDRGRLPNGEKRFETGSAPNIDPLFTDGSSFFDGRCIAKG
jgi:hypothetical protein